jgi:hypothetical protein
MATNKKKKEVKVRDLKPSKDAKGGAHRNADLGQRNRNADFRAQGKSGDGRSMDFRRVN